MNNSPFGSRIYLFDLVILRDDIKLPEGSWQTWTFHHFGISEK
jgi:hypothetical protein